MKCLFDSSAILRAIKENRIELLAGGCTLDLARYELGNIMWKDCVLHEKFSIQQAISMVKIVKHALNLMDVLGVTGNEEDMLEIALELNITFYDASYVYLAKARNLRLITEDSRLIRKIDSAANVSTLDSVR